MCGFTRLYQHYSLNSVCVSVFVCVRRVQRVQSRNREINIQKKWIGSVMNKELRMRDYVAFYYHIEVCFAEAWSTKWRVAL